MVGGALLPLVLDGVHVARAGQAILGPLSLVLDGAGITVLMGPNGAGKTTLLRVMHGLDRPTGGRVAWAVDTAAARARQAFVFQRPVVMRRRVIDCIAYPLRLDGAGRARARAAAARMAERTGLAAALDLPAEVLSGGEMQKMALARALIRDPQVLFLDEPCASLDGRATREIEDILRAARATGTRIVIATHDIAQARRLADEVVFLHNGTIRTRAPATRFFDAPGAPEARAYLNGELLP